MYCVLGKDMKAISAGYLDILNLELGSTTRIQYGGIRVITDNHIKKERIN